MTRMTRTEKSPAPRGHRRQRQGTRATTPWHWRIGVGASAFLLIWAVTGLLLNHAGHLGLDRVTVPGKYIPGHHAGAPEKMLHFAAGDGWVTWIGGALYVDDRRVAETPGTPLGAGMADGAVAVTGEDWIVLLAIDGTPIERLGPEALPGRVRAVGRTEDGDMAVVTEDGVFRPIAGFLGWEPVEDAVTQAGAAPPGAVPAGTVIAALAAYRGEGLALDRVLLELHTGRLFGRFGPYVMDAAALALIVVALTGLWAAARRRNGRD